jgi:hypothetical protein
MVCRRKHRYGTALSVLVSSKDVMLVQLLRPSDTIGQARRAWWRGFSLVVRAEYWHARHLGSNPRQGWPLYIWMYTPSAVSILGMERCAI